MGLVDMGVVVSCTVLAAARGRRAHGRVAVRHRDLKTGEGILPAEGLHRFCGLDRFPRFIHSGDARTQVRLYQVQGLPGVADGFYGDTGPAAGTKVIYTRWFGGFS